MVADKKEQNDRTSLILRAGIWLLLTILLSTARPVFTDYYFFYHVRIDDQMVRYLWVAAVAMFFVINWKKLNKVPDINRNLWKGLFMWILAGILFAVSSKKIGAFVGIQNFVLLEYGITFIRDGLIFLALLGIDFLKRWKKEIAVIALPTIIIKLSPAFVDAYWERSSTFIFYTLSKTIPLLHIPYILDASRMQIQLKAFRVGIGAPCAGIQSLLIFLALYASTIGLLILSKNNINILKAIGLLIMGLLLTYALNIMRVLMILLMGALYSAQFAISAFHSTIGALLFLGFFTLYLKLAVKRVVIALNRR